MRATALLCTGILLSGALSAQQSTPLDTSTFVVLGEGLAAGMADFALRNIYQDKSFPAQMARQMNTSFLQPLIEPPGIGSAPGFPALPPRLPGVLQGPVRVPFPPTTDLMRNLSVPGMRLIDSMTRRPTTPLIQPKDGQQTVINLTLGYPALIAGPSIPLLSQSEYATLALSPTFILVELGFYEVLDAAVADKPSALPDVTLFTANYANLLRILLSKNAKILVTTIPDPFDTAYFTTLPNATAFVGAPPALLASLYGLSSDVYLSPTGLSAIGDQIFSSLVYPPFLPAGITVSAATAKAVHDNVAALNKGIISAAQASGSSVQVYDLNGFFAGMKAKGLTVGSRKLTADYLGGIYSLDGYYPGIVGQSAIANDILTFINSTYRTAFKPIDLSTLIASDPAVRFTPSVRRQVVR